MEKLTKQTVPHTSFSEHLWSGVFSLGGKQEALHYTKLWVRPLPITIYIQIQIQIL